MDASNCRRATVSAFAEDRLKAERASGPGVAAPDHDQHHAALRRTEGRDCLCPEAAVRAVPARLLLSCLLFRRSWLAVEGEPSRRRRRSAASPVRTGSRRCAGWRGWWRSDAAVSRRRPRLLLPAGAKVTAVAAAFSQSSSGSQRSMTSALVDRRRVDWPDPGCARLTRTCPCMRKRHLLGCRALAWLRPLVGRRCEVDIPSTAAFARRSGSGKVRRARASAVEIRGRRRQPRCRFRHLCRSRGRAHRRSARRVDGAGWAKFVHEPPPCIVIAAVGAEEGLLRPCQLLVAVGV